VRFIKEFKNNEFSSFTFKMNKSNVLFNSKKQIKYIPVPYFNHSKKRGTKRAKKYKWEAE
jgi:hypothetical protein